MEDVHYSSSEDDGRYELSYVVHRKSSVQPPGEVAKQTHNHKLMLFVTCSILVAAVVGELTNQHLLEKYGVRFIVWLQHSVGFDPFWKAYCDVTGPPPSPTVLYVVAMVSWSGFAPRLSQRLFLLFATGVYLKWVLNLLLQQGRPFWVSPKVAMMHCPTCYGSPSGHALLYFLLLGPIFHHVVAPPRASAWPFRWRFAFLFNTRATRFLPWRSVLATVIVVIYINISFTRLYIGTHFPHSIVVGLCLGSSIVCICSREVFNRYVEHQEHVHGLFDGERQEANLRDLHDPEPQQPVAHKAFIAYTMALACLQAFVAETVVALQQANNPDPDVWEARSWDGCRKHLDTANLQVAYEGTLCVVGWLLSMKLSLHIQVQPAESRWNRYNIVAKLHSSEWHLLAAALRSVLAASIVALLVTGIPSAVIDERELPNGRWRALVTAPCFCLAILVVNGFAIPVANSSDTPWNNRRQSRESEFLIDRASQGEVVSYSTNVYMKHQAVG